MHSNASGESKPNNLGNLREPKVRKQLSMGDYKKFKKMKNIDVRYAFGKRLG